MRPFILFGTAHLTVIAVIAATTAGLVMWVRSHPGVAPVVRRAVASALLGLAVLAGFLLHREGVSWPSLVPLHLCDMTIFVAAWALLTLRPLAAEVTYFWAGAGTLLAVLTPDLAVGPPALTFFTFFGLHGAVIAAAFLLPFALGRPPRRGAVWRVLLVTNLYALAVGVVDWATRSNFFYLLRKPDQPSPLDWFGPWPVYLLVCELVAALLFLLLSLPFRGSWAAPGGGSA